jgi:predicted acylesterase/phospholipase RssA
MDNKTPFEKVCLSGGGIKGIIELGALHYYYEKRLYIPEKVHTYAATSIGSVISLLLICGFTPMEIFTKVYTSQEFFDPSNHSIWKIIENTGLMSINSFAVKIADMIHEKMDKIPTLKDLKRITGKTLIVTAGNITDMRIEYFGPKTHPNLNALEAVKMSCNLPIIFQKIKYREKIYVDGGIGDGFPIHYIDDKKSPILGIVTLGNDSSMKETTIMGYFYRLINMPINIITELRQRNLGKNVTLVKIKCNDVPILRISMSSEVKMNMFLEGFQEAEIVDKTEYIYIEGWNDPVITDDNSPQFSLFESTCDLNIDHIP